jgi:hypothetical protein
MQIEVIMTQDDFVTINRLLLEKTGFHMYAANEYDDSIKEVDLRDYRPANRMVLLLIGPKSLGDRIVGMRAGDNRRADKVGFVNANFGGENEDAIGTTFYTSDPSDTDKLVSRELKKILKTHASLGVKDHAAAEPAHVFRKYWTPEAQSCGKNWTTWLGFGVNEYKNKLPGWVPTVL